MAWTPERKTIDANLDATLESLAIGIEDLDDDELQVVKHAHSILREDSVDAQQDPDVSPHLCFTSYCSYLP